MFVPVSQNSVKNLYMYWKLLLVVFNGTCLVYMNFFMICMKFLQMSLTFVLSFNFTLRTFYLILLYFYGNLRLRNRHSFGFC